MMKFANIIFHKNSVISQDFDDTYFSKNNALNEKEYVFLKQNNIPQFWQDKKEVAIGENGFGLGLNFLLAYKAFIESKSSAKFKFYSFDLFPLKYRDLKKVYENFSELKPFTCKLLEQYKNLKSGKNEFVFKDEDITLILFIDEALNALKDFEKVDIWFLDGFAPSKNMDIYRDEIFQEIKNKSKKNAIFSTYSSAGIIKKGMQSAGFEVEKVKGFGEKKHMLKGKLVE